MKTACPRCGANVSFMPGTQKLYCEYCGSQVDVLEFNLDVNEVTKISYDEYTCSTCGAKLITDETTIITDCVYCGSRQILKAKFQGEFNPVEIIPFKIDRNEFINIYKKFIKKKIFAPKEFKNNSRLIETKGIYVPFHLFFFDLDIYARGEADVNDREDTFYKKYFENEFSMKILAPVDSRKNFNDNVMTSLEPFNYKELRKFNPVFLNGFLSECGNEDMEELERKAENRGIKESVEQLRERLEGCYIVKGKLQTNFKKLESRYVLLPVWFINTWYKNKLYTYAVNGQTGKIVGKIPINKSKCILFVLSCCALMTIFSFILLFGGIYFESSNGISIGSSILVILILSLMLLVPIIILIETVKYNNIKDVQYNSIQSWDIKPKRNNKYSKEQYEKIFGERELNKLDIQLLRNGVNVKELNKNTKKKI